MRSTLALFHDSIRLRNLRPGIVVEYTPRKLNAVAVGVTATWCPDRFVRGELAWCPATATAAYVFGDRDGVFETGVARGKAMTTLEARRSRGFARLSAGLQLEDYVHDFVTTDGTVSQSFWLIASSVVEVAVGLDL